MAIEPHRQTINNNEWVVYPWPARYGFKIKVELAELIGPALGEMAGSGSLDNLQVSHVAKLVFDRLHSDQALDLVLKMMNGVMVNERDMSNPKHFDEHFRQNYAELYEGVYYILKVNFDDVFTMAGRFMSDMKPSEPAKEDSDS